MVAVISRTEQGTVMVGLSEIIAMGSSAAGGVKALMETVKLLKEVQSSSEPKTQKLLDGPIETLRDKLTELQSKQLEMQSAALAIAEANMRLSEQYRAAHEELAKLKQFDADRERYERVTLALNTFAYREKGLQGPADAQPLLCPNCFDRHQKSYLSFQQHAIHTKEMKCTTCNTTVHLPRDDGPTVQVARVRSRRGWEFFDDI